MIEATLRVHLPCSWVTLLMTERSARVNVVEQKDLGGAILQSLVEIHPDGADPGALLASLRKNPDVVKVEAEVPSADRILVTLQVRDCRACHALAESECFLTDATAVEGGGLDWNILAPDRRAVEGLLQRLDPGRPAEILSLRSVKAAGLLTDRQEKVMGLAYQLGYFEFPKHISLTGLAERLGVAKSTLSEILRTGEAKVLHAYFHGLLRKGR